MRARLTPVPGKRFRRCRLVRHVGKNDTFGEFCSDKRADASPALSPIILCLAIRYGSTVVWRSISINMGTRSEVGI